MAQGSVTAPALGDLLSKRDRDLKAIAQRLLEKEVLEGEELRQLLGNRTLAGEGNLAR